MKNAAIMLENNGDIIALVKVVAEFPRMNFVPIFIVVEFALEPYDEFFTRTKSCSNSSAFNHSDPT